jgi:hypothetical protein
VAVAAMSAAPHPNIVTSAEEAIRIAGDARTVVVLGCKTEAQASQPAFFVPEFVQSSGARVIPVPTYYPHVQEILGQPVVRDLKAIGEQVDILDVFRRQVDLPAHVPDILAMRPRPEVVWLQTGISHPQVERELAEAGIKVVAGRCLKVDRAAAGRRERF